MRPNLRAKTTKKTTSSCSSSSMRAPAPMAQQHAARRRARQEPDARQKAPAESPTMPKSLDVQRPSPILR